MIYSTGFSIGYAMKESNLSHLKAQMGHLLTQKVDRNLARSHLSLSKQKILINQIIITNHKIRHHQKSVSLIL